MQTFSELEGDDQNMIVKVHWPYRRFKFADYLESEANAIKQIVAHHLSLRPHQCTIAPRNQWICGTFNVCMPVTLVDSDPPKRVMVRCPLPHRFSSPTSPDMASEKLRSEAATFAWLSEHCPDVPIPRLWGFGLADGRSFTPLAHASWLPRAYEMFRRRVWRAISGLDDWRPFVLSTISGPLKTGYVVMDFIERSQGEMLDAVEWPSSNPHHRQTLFRSLARIMLAMMRVPLPRIGSFTVGDLGEVTLSARPLTAPLASLEAEDIPTDMPPSTTYHTSDTYIDDLIHCHTARLEHQPNAVRGRDDAVGQLATVVALRAMRSYFTDRSLREGPFFLQFTDLHGANIFINDKYEVTAIVDLEWCCSLPLEMQQLPFWFSGNEADDFLADDASKKNEKAFDTACKEFFDIFDKEQNRQNSQPGPSLDVLQVMRAGLERKSRWYFDAVLHPRVAYSLMVHHLQPLFAPSHASEEGEGTFQDAFAPYYGKDVSEFITRKVSKKAEYDEILRTFVYQQK